MVAADVYVGGRLLASLSGDGDADRLLAEARALVADMWPDKRICFEVRDASDCPDRASERTRIADKVLSWHAPRGKQPSGSSHPARNKLVEGYLDRYRMSGR